MQPISDNTRELIHQLLERPSLGERLFGHKADRAELLSQIGAAGEPASIPYVLPLALTDDRVADAAASAVARILETVPPLESVEFDRWLRGSGPSEYGQFLQWDRLRPADLSRSDRLEDGWAVLAIATCHRNGRVREAAIRQLPDEARGQALPFLILRMNDWVDPVRLAAESAMQAFLESPEPEALIRALPLLFRMPAWRRRNHQPFVDAALQLLQQPEASHGLARGRESGDRHVRRECYRLSLGAPDVDPVAVAERGLADADVLVRLRAVCLLRCMDDAELRRFAEIARADPFMAVRRQALDIAADRFPAEAVSWLRIGLLDSHSGMRDFARYRLSQRSDAFDVREFYREAVQVSAGRRLRAALLGLQETGIADDALLALPFCADGQPKIREAAVRAVARLDYENHAAVILHALADESPRVSRRARTVLGEKRIFSMTAQIWDYLRSDHQPRHVRLNALRLLESLSKWALLPFLLRASALADPDIARAAREQVEVWVAEANRSFVKPTAEQDEEIMRALQEGEKALGPTVTEQIRAEVRFWRRAS